MKKTKVKAAIGKVAKVAAPIVLALAVRKIAGGKLDLKGTALDAIEELVRGAKAKRAAASEPAQ